MLRLTVRIMALCGVAAAVFAAAPARAGDFWSPDKQRYWHIRHDIYERVELIAHLEANPDIDDAIKGPAISAARAEVHGLRSVIGRPPRKWATPCCYTRRPLYIR
jgi:hypothetical protein